MRIQFVVNTGEAETLMFVEPNGSTLQKFDVYNPYTGTVERKSINEEIQIEGYGSVFIVYPLDKEKVDLSVPVTISVKVTAADDPETGTTVASIGASDLNGLFERIIEAESYVQKVIAEIKVETTLDIKSVKVEIPGNVIKQLAGTQADFKIDTGIGTITFDPKAINSLGDAALGRYISASIKKVEKESLQADALKKVQKSPVYKFSIETVDTEISKFGGGHAVISIPYTMNVDEEKNPIKIYHIDSKGKLKKDMGKYNPETGCVEFKL